MRVKDFGCLFINNSRSKAYLQKLLACSLFPEKIIYIDLVKKKKRRSDHGKPSTPAEAIMASYRGRKYFMYSNRPNSICPFGDRKAEKYRTFDPEKSVLEILEESSLEYEVVQASSLNDEAVIGAIGKCRQNYFLFSGGGLLREEILGLPKKMIHIHPGYVPDVKGSMAIEWSILTGERCAASAFYMVKEIDEGEIIARKHFDIPKLEHNNLPPLFSPHIRSEVLVEIIKKFMKDGQFTATRQDSSEGVTYYKMHPLLNNLVFFKCLPT